MKIEITEKGLGALLAHCDDGNVGAGQPRPVKIYGTKQELDADFAPSAAENAKAAQFFDPDREQPDG